MITTETIPNTDQTMNVVRGEASWRLVHDTTRVITLFYSAGTTWTRQSVFTAPTKPECDAEIARLGLR